MSYQRDEKFDSIYASIDDDDLDEMYVDVSSTPQTSFQGPSPYVYPQAAQPPPSPSVRKLPPLPVKSTIAAASKPPWPRPAPQPPEDQESIKISSAPKSSNPNRNVPLPLPRTATMKKKDSNRPVPKYRLVQPQQQATNTGYKPPPSIVPANRQATGQSGYPKRDGAAATRYHDIEIQPANSTQANTKLIISPPRGSPPLPPNPAFDRQDFASEENFPTSGYILNSPNVNDNSEYESLRPARSRLRRGYGQQSRSSRRYSNDQILLQDMASDVEERQRNRGHRRRKERKEAGEDNISKSDNSRVVCILLTIIVVSLLISLMSLAMSLYTLTRFLQSNTAASECDMNVTNCTMMA